MFGTCIVLGIIETYVGRASAWSTALLHFAPILNF